MVRRLVEWFVEHNRHYADVKLDAAALDSIPVGAFSPDMVVFDINPDADTTAESKTGGPSLTMDDSQQTREAMLLSTTIHMASRSVNVNEETAAAIRALNVESGDAKSEWSALQAPA